MKTLVDLEKVARECGDDLVRRNTPYARIVPISTPDQIMKAWCSYHHPVDACEKNDESNYCYLFGDSPLELLHLFGCKKHFLQIEIKIGSTSDPRARIRTHRTTKPTGVYWHIWYGLAGGGESLEKRLQRFFKNFASSGEYFLLNEHKILWLRSQSFWDLIELTTEFETYEDFCPVASEHWHPNQPQLEELLEFENENPARSDFAHGARTLKT